MLAHDEKRDYIRMEVDCDITYKLANSQEIKTGRCTTLSGAGVSFLADSSFEAGLAMEVSIIPKTSITPPMTAFIEVVRSVKRDENQYEIAASIKSIKGS
ncbi:PilZ domain-containing protein [Methylomonas sp. SURF-2]|uniref:PilZ domain-containing protein n=1 Tax=Methylomonas subterranea TaxID=2952225 RepID=A0ABT1TIK2_9GAMM|nr:PilZ domain-containing protein [Methylomonas sp. SURF-2]MCQ8105144.1 PilZ domain-containing protein [Methylomonas sp. SURF-2]